MAKITRKEMKSDKFAEEVFDIFDWTSHHRDLVLRYGGIVLAVAVVAGGVWFFLRHQAGVRADQLVAAQRISDATVGMASGDPSLPRYNTQAEKDEAVAKAYAPLAAQPSTDEGAIAGMYLAGVAVDKGNLADAEKRYREVVDHGPSAYAAMARIALADVLQVQGRTADAEKLLRAAVDNAAITVSKDEATIALAQALMKSNPAEARKLLEPLRTSPRGAVARAAGAQYAELPLDAQTPVPAPGAAK